MNRECSRSSPKHNPNGGDDESATGQTREPGGLPIFAVVKRQNNMFSCALKRTTKALLFCILLGVALGSPPWDPGEETSTDTGFVVQTLVYWVWVG